MSGPARPVADEPSPTEGTEPAATRAPGTGAQDFLAQRRERLIAEQRAQNLSTGLMVAFGAVVLAAVVAFVMMSGDDGEIAQEPGDPIPASLAFDGLGAATGTGGFDPHANHDHGAIVARPHYSDDYSLTKLGGDVPPIIQQNLQLPDDSEVIHVIVQTEGVWEFEGVYPGGEQFWKIIDLNRRLIYDGGGEARSEPFPRVFG